MNDDPEAGPRCIGLVLIVTMCSLFWMAVGVWIGEQL
jgi:hypothetical protein